MSSPTGDDRRRRGTKTQVVTDVCGSVAITAPPDGIPHKGSILIVAVDLVIVYAPALHGRAAMGYGEQPRLMPHG